MPVIAERPLAKYMTPERWTPKIGDFVIWHGWFKRWYGVVSGINKGEVLVITENLPKLLLTLSSSKQAKNTKKISIYDIQASSGGEYCIIQGDIFFID